MAQEISSQIKTPEVMVVNYGLDLVGAIAILVIGWIVAGWIGWPSVIPKVLDIDTFHRPQSSSR